MIIVQYLLLQLIMQKCSDKECRLFDRSFDDRVDAFCAHIFDSNNTFDSENIVRVIFILSYGNASVKSGFCTNDIILLPNMLTETIITQRFWPITLESMKMVKNSHRTYTHVQDEKKTTK